MTQISYKELTLPLPLSIKDLAALHSAEVMAALNSKGIKLGKKLTGVTIALIEPPEDQRDDVSIFDDFTNTCAISRIANWLDSSRALQIPLGGGSFVFSCDEGSGGNSVNGIYHQFRHKNGALTAALFIDDYYVEYGGDDFYRQIDDRLIERDDESTAADIADVVKATEENESE